MHIATTQTTLCEHSVNILWISVSNHFRYLGSHSYYHLYWTSWCWMTLRSSVIRNCTKNLCRIKRRVKKVNINIPCFGGNSMLQHRSRVFSVLISSHATTISFILLNPIPVKTSSFFYCDSDGLFWMQSNSLKLLIQDKPHTPSWASTY